MSTSDEGPSAGMHRDRGASFGGYPDFASMGKQARPAPEPTPEELARLLGAEPIKNGPAAANHLAYCKWRALEFAPPDEAGDAGLAMNSLIQDFGEDPRTADSIGVIRELMLPLAMTGNFGTPGKLREFILGFQ